MWIIVSVTERPFEVDCRTHSLYKAFIQSFLVCLQKDIGSRLMPAFNTPSKIDPVLGCEHWQRYGPPAALDLGQHRGRGHEHPAGVQGARPPHTGPTVRGDD